MVVVVVELCGDDDIYLIGIVSVSIQEQFL